MTEPSGRAAWLDAARQAAVRGTTRPGAPRPRTPIVVAGLGGALA